jgi:hypothetical protein
MTEGTKSNFRLTFALVIAWMMSAIASSVSGVSESGGPLESPRRGFTRAPHRYCESPAAISAARAPLVLPQSIGN